jgi:hypothetical protein
MIELTIAVTKKDIQQGRKCSSSMCPIALAMTQAATNLGLSTIKVSADLTYLKIYMYKTVIIARTPRDAWWFMRKVDNNENRQPPPVLEPFTFTAKFV